MQTMYNYLIALGVPSSAIHYEFFGAALPLEGPPKIGPVAESAYEVRFSKTNKAAKWTGEHVSILELAESIDVPVTSSCRMGTCLSCESRLIEGEVKYDPEPFVEAEEGQVLICCSQPETDLIIDL